MKFFITLISCVAYATAYTCCPSMDQYEYSTHLYGGIYVNSIRYADSMSATLDMHVDKTNLKFATDEYVVAFGKKTSYQLVQDYTQKVQYLVVDGHCTKLPLTRQIGDFTCIPAEAKLLGSYEYAMGQLNGSDYQYIHKQFGQTQNTIQTVTDDCLPLATQISGEDDAKTMKFVLGGTYVNITPGIKDPSVFDIPSSCSHKTAVGPLKLDPLPVSNVVGMAVHDVENRV